MYIDWNMTWLNFSLGLNFEIPAKELKTPKNAKIIYWNEYFSKTKNTKFMKLVSFKGEKRVD